MTIGKSYHIALDIDASFERHGRYVTVDGAPLTSGSFEDLRAEMKRKGYKVFPPCDSVTGEGRCAGHESSEGQIKCKNFRSDLI